MTPLRMRLGLILVVLLAFAGCGGGGGGGGGGGPACLPGPGPNYGAFAQNPTPAEAQLALDVFNLVNQERANNIPAVPALASDAVAAKVAFDYAVDMETRGFFSHTNPECEDPGTRLTRGGVVWTAYGENIALGQTTAAQVMNDWMNSPGHRANILDPNFTMIGIGVRQAAGGTIWVQNFFKP